MASEDVGLAELTTMLRKSWGLIVGLAAASGLAAFVAVSLLTSSVYLAVARLVVLPSESADGRGSQTPQVYHAFLGSDSILQQTTAKLVDKGVLTPGTVLARGRDIASRIETGGQGQTASVIMLTARTADPASAAAVANTWAQVFIEESRIMLKSTATEREKLLEAQLAPTRQRLKELESEMIRLLSEYETREGELRSHWERQISNAKSKAERAAADYRTRSRGLMEEAVGRHGIELFGPTAPADLRIALLEIVSLRAQLSTSPRVLTLEKTASDELMADMIGRGRFADSFGARLESQEINPFYDELSLRALQLETEIKRLAGTHLETVSGALAELEKIQFERLVGWTALLEDSDRELRSLRRQLKGALADLRRERASFRAVHERGLDQLRDLESSLFKRLNSAVLAALLEQVDTLSLASPAIPNPTPESRRVPLKVAVAVFLGGLLGLAISLIRFTATGESVDSEEVRGQD